MIMDAQAALQDLLKLAVRDPKRDDDITIGGDDPVLPTNYLLGAAGAALSALGFSPEALAELRPGTVYVSLSAYGHQGPWRLKRGFDSPVQSVSGIVHDESQGGTPRHIPAQALDYVSGYLMAFGAMGALACRAQEGGSYLVRVSLCQTGHWIHQLGRLETGSEGRRHPDLQANDLQDLFIESGTPFGRLRHVAPAVQLSETPRYWARPTVPFGFHKPEWPK
jgi:CoA-transferase family III